MLQPAGGEGGEGGPQPGSPALPIKGSCAPSLSPAPHKHPDTLSSRGPRTRLPREAPSFSIRTGSKASHQQGDPRLQGGHVPGGLAGETRVPTAREQRGRSWDPLRAPLRPCWLSGREPQLSALPGPWGPWAALPGGGGGGSSLGLAPNSFLSSQRPREQELVQSTEGDPTPPAERGEAALRRCVSLLPLRQGLPAPRARDFPCALAAGATHTTGPPPSGGHLTQQVGLSKVVFSLESVRGGRGRLGKPLVLATQPGDGASVRNWGPQGPRLFSLRRKRGVKYRSRQLSSLGPGPARGSPELGPRQPSTTDERLPVGRPQAQAAALGVPSEQHGVCPGAEPEETQASHSRGGGDPPGQRGHLKGVNKLLLQATCFPPSHTEKFA